MPSVFRGDNVALKEKGFENRILIAFLLQKVEEMNSGNSKGKYVTTTIAMKRKKNRLNCVSNGAYLVLEWCFPKSSLPLNFRTNNFIAFRSTALT